MPNPPDQQLAAKVGTLLDGLHDAMLEKHGVQPPKSLRDAITCQPEIDEAKAALLQAFQESQPLPSIPIINDVDCPACGHPTLILGEGGYITCSLEGCPNPDYSEAFSEQKAEWEKVAVRDMESSRGHLYRFVDGLQTDYRICLRCHLIESSAGPRKDCKAMRPKMNLRLNVSKQAPSQPAQPTKEEK